MSHFSAKGVQCDLCSALMAIKELGSLAYHTLSDTGAPLVIEIAALIWLKYCRYGVKPYTINQSINHVMVISAHRDICCQVFGSRSDTTCFNDFRTVANRDRTLIRITVLTCSNILTAKG